MIVDTSALIAILRSEPDARRYAEAIEAAVSRRLAAPTLVELAAALDGGRDPIVSRGIDDLLSAGHIEIEAFTARQAAVARDAYRDFGRGSGHPARLNLGDCFSYALARTSDEPLLFKDDDFSHTDIRAALAA